MSQPNPDPLKQAQDYIRRGELPKAQRLLVDFVKQNPNSEQGWYLLSQAVTDSKRQIDCLQRVLRLNPANTEAQRQLVKAMSGSSEPAKPEAPAPAAVAAAAASVESGAPASSLPSAVQPVGSAPVVKPVEVTPVPAPEPPLSAEPQSPDADLGTLRTQLQSSAEAVEKRRKRRKPLRVVMLLLLLLLLVMLSAYFFVLRPMQSPAAAPAAVPNTPTPTVTLTPSDTPTPSITPTRFPPTWTPTPRPTAIPTHTPTPLPPLNGAVATALNQVQADVAKLRGLKLESVVPRALIDNQALEPALKSVLDLPDVLSTLPNQARALSALGLIKPTYDLNRYFLNAFVDGIGGFYVPWQKVLYVVGQKLEAEQRLAFAHVIDHVLLDQNFHVDNLGVSPQCQLDQQRCQAIRALIEGDSTLLMQQWLAQSASDQDKKDLIDYQRPVEVVPEQYTSVFITQDLRFPFTAGLEFVKMLYQNGGWAQVNKAYDNLPQSTEQILHPQKYLDNEQPIPVAAVPLTNTLGPGWQLVFDDVLGEWTTYLLLSSSVDDASRMPDAIAKQAAAGWGGDRVQVYYKPEADQTVMTAEWVWDTPTDVKEFHDALAAYFDRRFRGVRVNVPGLDCWSLNYQVSCLTVRDKSVLWLLTPDLTTLSQVRAEYKIP